MDAYKRYGGGAGYNEVTNESLWPFPNEDIIQSTMRNYSYDNGKLSGNRGFAATGKQLNGVDDITLTSYIWEYLGNPIPAEIYIPCANDFFKKSFVIAGRAKSWGLPQVEPQKTRNS